MRGIADSTTKVASTVTQLGKGSEQIGKIISVIDDIADQTNLLALNAAIEAARAGEQGRGFAVVADEVRKLAERTTKATKEITDMIESIQRETQNAVQAMEQEIKEVQVGVEATSASGAALREIIKLSEDVGDMIATIATAATNNLPRPGKSTPMSRKSPARPRNPRRQLRKLPVVDDSSRPSICSIWSSSSSLIAPSPSTSLRQAEGTTRTPESGYTKAAAASSN